MLCKENWRSLVPLWRTSPAYQVLRSTHESYEGAHHRWRERYAVAGDTKADRPKRRGLGVQQLRASAALVIEWLTICHRQGWLEEPVLNPSVERSLSPEDAASYCKGILKMREALGLSSCPPDAMPAHQTAVLAYHETSSHGSKQSIATLVAATEDDPPPG